MEQPYWLMDFGAVMYVPTYIFKAGIIHLPRHNSVTEFRRSVFPWNNFVWVLLIYTLTIQHSFPHDVFNFTSNLSTYQIYQTLPFPNHNSVYISFHIFQANKTMYPLNQISVESSRAEAVDSTNFWRVNCFDVKT